MGGPTIVNTVPYNRTLHPCHRYRVVHLYGNKITIIRDRTSVGLSLCNSQEAWVAYESVSLIKAGT